MNKPLNRTKYHIVRAAIDLFSVKGFGTTSIREISEAAQVNSALISYHFKSKQGLLEWIMIDYFEKLFDLLKRKEIGHLYDDSDYFGQLIAAADTVILHQCKNLEVSTIIQREMSVDSMLVREVMSTYMARLKAVFATLIERGMEKGEFRQDVDIDMLIVHMLSSLFFPYFNPQIVREVVYVEPMSEEFRSRYVEFLKRTWTFQIKN